jgi:homoaconitase/3-isopropylmalate dehydratase large subunit
VADYAPVYGRPQQVSFTAGAAITGGQLLSFSAADTVIPAANNAANYAGVAGHDAASGAPVTVLMGSGVVHETLATAATAAGALVFAGSATAGQLGATSTGYGAVGVAVRATAGANGLLRWKALVG